MKTTHLILKNILHLDDYTRHVMPILKEEYFDDLTERRLFGYINKFVNEYNSRPSLEVLKILNAEATKISNEDKEATEELILTWKDKEEHNIDWLLAETEKFCKDQAIFNALSQSLEILNNPKDKRDKGAIPDLLRDALAVSIDSKIGHDFIDAADERFDFYRRKEERIPFDLEMLNKITGGGLPKKTLTIIVAGVNVGKSLAMCHMATANLLAGKNVLYITCEMAEEVIGERIDANALDITLDSLKQISKKQYLTAMKGLHNRTSGKLIIKEYPTSSVNVSNFRFLLHELEIKKKFVPDIIYVDYLNICTSSTIKNTGLVNSYTLIKNISEEFRGLAVEKNLPIVTASQFTRSGSTNSDSDMTDIAESFGIAATADLVLALIKTDELTQMNQLMFKQLKNRFADVTKYVKFLVGVDRNKMRLYDLGDNSGVEGEFQQPTPELLMEDNNSKMKKFGSFKF